MLIKTYKNNLEMKLETKSRIKIKIKTFFNELSKIIYKVAQNYF